MAPSRYPGARFAVCGVLLAFVLYGCDQEVKGHVDSFIGVICKTTMTKVVEDAKSKLEKDVYKKCESLKDLAIQHGFDEEFANEKVQVCLDTVGLIIEDATEEQAFNFTEVCIHSIRNITDMHWSELTRLVKDFAETGNFTAFINGVIDEDTAAAIGKFIEDLNVTNSGTEEGAKNSTEESKEGDSKGGESKEKEGDSKEGESKEAASKEKEGDSKQDESNDGDAHKADGNSRLFDSELHLAHSTGQGYTAVLACLFAVAGLLAAVGPVRLLRRSAAHDEQGTALLGSGGASGFSLGEGAEEAGEADA